MAGRHVPAPTALVPWPNEGGFIYPAAGAIPEFRDVLWLTPDELAGASEEELQARARARYDSFVAVVTPAEPVEDTAESLAEQVEGIKAQMRDLMRQQLDLEDRIAALPAEG